MFILNLIPAISCGESPLIKNSYSKIVEGSYGDRVTFTCIPGFWFTRGQPQWTSDCSESGNWTLPKKTCQGKVCYLCTLEENRLHYQKYNVSAFKSLPEVSVVVVL